ncbi:hypothetical protein GCM10023196_059580 [Actinoallomurus vinaceus]|uniref:DUF5666 domain-containing protein n=1 Tax=Actinoallomurus vinaceus TaxID=1080074 RepID=A0ABP8UJ20_9ACTN
MPGTRRKGSDAPLDDVPPEQLLRTSPFDGDLAEELAAAEPRQARRIPSATVLLAAGVLLVAGFVGGVQADKHWGTKQSPTGFAQFARGAGQGTGGYPGFGGGTGQRGAFGQGGFGQGGTGQGGQQNGAAAPGAAPGAGGPGSGAAAGGAGTTGTVKLVDGDVIYVQTANGIVRVKTTGSTKVSVTKSAKLTDLKSGAPIVVQGTPGQDGSVTATAVTQSR